MKQKNYERGITMDSRKNFPSIRETAKRGPLTEYCLRMMLKQGNLPGVYSGKKFCVNYCALLEQLGASEKETA